MDQQLAAIRQQLLLGRKPSHIKTTLFILDLHDTILITSSPLHLKYTATQLCASCNYRHHASHLFYETIAGSYRTYILTSPPDPQEISQRANANLTLQASQLQNPPPPSSSTKSGRLFGKGGLGQYKSYDVDISRSLHDSIQRNIGIGSGWA